MSPTLCLQDLERHFGRRVQRQGGVDPVSLQWAFEQVSTDSRSVGPGDLFVPLRGERFDGHDYLEAALSVGAAGALVADDWRGTPPAGLATLEVPDTQAAYQQVAGLWRRQLRAPVVAVTGSAGKTTTRELIRACLAPLGPVEASVGNENNDIGVPRTLLRCRADAAAVVIEMGMRGLGEIERLSVCARPDVAVITNIGTAHIGRLGSREAIATAKCEIAAALDPAGLLVVPAGDPLLEAALAAAWSGTVCRVALHDDERAPDTPAPDRLGVLLADGRLRVEGGAAPLELTLPLEGRHNARNLLLALAVAERLQVPAAALQALAVTLPGGRARRVVLAGDLAGVTVLDETYNASPEAMLASLDLLAAQPGGRKFAVLGTMLELGDRSLELHRAVGERARNLGLAGLVVVAAEAEAEAMLAGAAGLPLLQRAASPEAAAAPLRQWLQAGDHVLLKASRGVALERLLTTLAPDRCG
jgi:UDP-N-acetylmuramoyl-tripeptide--D-alanyl-D-alanine ligase